MKKCKHCNSDFEPKSKKAEFCSDKCRVYFGRKEKSAVYGKSGIPINPKENASEIVKEVFTINGERAEFINGVFKTDN